MTHTRTPWHTAGSVIHAGDNGYAIADIDGDNGESVIDAEHIVKCVNAHDELVAALEGAMFEATNISSTNELGQCVYGCRQGRDYYTDEPLPLKHISTCPIHDLAAILAKLED